MYKGLPIITNKPSLSEQKGIPHHLLDFVDTADAYIVSDFERDALKLVSGLHIKVIF
jgi:tRNA dimethylallyltransferase